MSRARVTKAAIETLALCVGLDIHYELGGARIYKSNSDGSRTDIFPKGGICPTTTRRECYLFLKGAYWAASQNRKKI